MSEEKPQNTQLMNILEGAIFAAGEPLSVQKMQTLFDADEVPEKEQILEILEAIKASCEGRGIDLIEVASGWRFQVRENIAQWVNRLWEEKPQKYSRALLETLALIAYRQPITRGDIEEVRGVAVSSHIIKTLSERDWIKSIGHRDVPGRPALYATTKTFLDYFNLKSLDELPTLGELKDIDSLNKSLEFEGEAGEPAQNGEVGQSEQGESETASDSQEPEAQESDSQEPGSQEPSSQELSSQDISASNVDDEASIAEKSGQEASSDEDEADEDDVPSDDTSDEPSVDSANDSANESVDEEDSEEENSELDDDADELGESENDDAEIDEEVLSSEEPVSADEMNQADDELEDTMDESEITETQDDESAETEESKPKVELLETFGGPSLFGDEAPVSDNEESADEADDINELEQKKPSDE